MKPFARIPRVGIGAVVETGAFRPIAQGELERFHIEWPCTHAAAVRHEIGDRERTFHERADSFERCDVAAPTRRCPAT